MPLIAARRTTRVTLALFLLTGALTAAVYYSVLAIALEVAHAEYHLAVTVAYAAGVIFQFFTNRSLTFQATVGGMRGQIFRFCVFIALNYVLTLIIVTFGVRYLSLNPYLSVLLSLMITTPIGFLLTRHWVFRSVSIK